MAMQNHEADFPPLPMLEVKEAESKTVPHERTQALEGTNASASIITAFTTATTTTNTNTDNNFAVALKPKKRLMHFSKEKLLACKKMFTKNEVTIQLQTPENTTKNIAKKNPIIYKTLNAKTKVHETATHGNVEHQQPTSQPNQTSPAPPKIDTTPSSPTTTTAPHEEEETKKTHTPHPKFQTPHLNCHQTAPPPPTTKSTHSVIDPNTLPLPPSDFSDMSSDEDDTEDWQVATG
ncbi:uncharacterized protein LOC128249176 [Octopus bimaculoides]|uniref:uncharacterized protein LOC128249176 n=1 Tax=Octopus bimaculoides TaxID=37653 RepID=UPI0022E0794C|nr:uncharacterized protein LOC128249176 [Octopus bimaculoides]